MARANIKREDPFTNRYIDIDGVKWKHNYNARQLELADMVVKYGEKGLEQGKIDARKIMILEGLI